MIKDSEQIITLIKSHVTYDDLGVAVAEERHRQAYAVCSSIGQSEYWSSAAQHDVKPEGRATIFYYDYDDETEVEIEHVRYSVYRSYREGDRLTLYLQRKVRNV